jgi:hypothetical protein
MSCDPFDNQHAIVKTNWHNSKLKKIVLKDAKSHNYEAEYEGDYTFNAFNVDNGLLTEVSGEKMCDKLLLKCPKKQKEKTILAGSAYFIECKTESDLNKAYKQMSVSFARLNKQYENWLKEYPNYYFRVSWRTRVINIQNYSKFNQLRDCLPKGAKQEIHIIVDRFSERPDFIK